MSDSGRPVRKSPRLKGYDYTQEGAYFVTICTHQRQFLFGEVVNGEMRLNELGLITEECWELIPDHFPHMELDAFVVMPNHVHGILLIAAPPVLKPQQPSSFVGTRHASSAATPRDNQPRGTMHGSLYTAMGSYKSAVTRRVRQHMQTDDTSIWQISFHDHIIRSEQSLNKIRHYVLNNPALWQNDQFFASG
ncbi:MAG: transposase [Anaerolineae bacterium]